ncbi:hypothetical protein N7520_007782 [Penicillium odoratum]|uniref:uncharacterized protein n=1 Tax=Penicillium odoratum TaxID=1167516 RepID=UPI00254841C4|nr:uncharacterized protein N7520_007782 [Penicillium odoratum]KAJ5760626.1 hypothetical protein N7520_007782 [Penicillium odoratum]
MSKNLLLFGATGAIGSFILEAILSARPQFDRVAIFTSPRTAETKASHLEKLKAQNVEIIVGDIEDEDAIKAAYTGTTQSNSIQSNPTITHTYTNSPGIDTIISSLGRTALALQIPLIRLAAATPSIKLFLPSEYGTDIAYGPASVNEKPHQQKLKVRAVLEGIPRDQLSYAYVVTGPFAEMYLHFSSDVEGGGWDVKGRKAVLLGTGEERISLTTMKDSVGTLVLSTLLHASPDNVNRAFCVNSFTTTPASIQKEFERQVGGTWDVSFTSLDRLRELERKAWEEGKGTATVLTLRRIWTEGGTLYEERANGVIGEPRVMGLEEVVANEIKRVASL